MQVQVRFCVTRGIMDTSVHVFSLLTIISNPSITMQSYKLLITLHVQLKMFEHTHGDSVI